MSRFRVFPDGPYWYVAGSTLPMTYSYEKRSAAISMARTLTDTGDTLVIHQFDGVVKQEQVVE